MRRLIKEFKERWLTALTDGSYTRYKHSLANPEDPKERCCLGVALAIAAEMGIITPEQVKDNYLTNSYLTPTVASMIGLSDSEQRTLGLANDDHRVPEGKFYPDEVISKITEFETE